MYLSCPDFGLNQPRRGLALCCFLLAATASAQTITNAPPADQGPAAYKKLTLQELMDLDVTSVAKTPQPYGEAPAAIQVITGQDIERSAASSIPEALRLADNLEVAQVNSHDWAISARGFNTQFADKLLVLMDGRTLYTPLFSGVFWDMQDYLLADLDRIEVISGPGGTLWGENAVNGVINITTKNAKDTQGVYLEAGGGTELQDFTGVRYGGTLASNVYFRVYGKYFDRNSEVLSDGKSADDAWDQARTGFRIDALPASANQLTVQGDFYRGDEDDENVPTNGALTRVAGGNLLGRFTHTFDNGSDMSLQAYFDRTYLKIPKAGTAPLAGALAAIFPPFPSGNLTDALNTYDVDFQHHFHLGERNNVVWGLGFRNTQENVENAPALRLFPPNLNQNLYSGFAQDEIMLHEKFHVTLGTKLEHNDFTGYEVEPSGRVQWDVATNQMVWGAISRAVRAPSVLDRDENIPIAMHFPIDLLKGSSSFESEKLLAYEVGYRAQLGDRVTVSVATFYNIYTDVRSLTQTLPLVWANGLEGRTYGFELAGNYQVFDWWRLHAGYDFLKEDIRVEPGQTDFSHALNEVADPQNQVSLRSSMDLPHGLELDLDSRWVDSFIINNSGTPATVAGYFEMDARLGWHINQHIELSLVGQNLLQAQHPEYSVPSASRVEIARAFYAKMSYRW